MTPASMLNDDSVDSCPLCSGYFHKNFKKFSLSKITFSSDHMGFKCVFIYTYPVSKKECAWFINIPVIGDKMGLYKSFGEAVQRWHRSAGGRKSP